MSVNLYVIIETADGKTLESDFCYEYPREISQTDFMKACIRNYNEQQDSNPCPELKLVGYEILVNGNLLRARVLGESLFQSSDVDPELMVKVITIRRRTTRGTSPPPNSPPPNAPPPPVINPLPSPSGEANPPPGQLSSQEIIILQHILSEVNDDKLKFPKPITQTAVGIYDQKDIRKRSTELENILRELSLIEPILSVCAGNLVGDISEVRKYAKNITMPPIKDGAKDDPAGEYYASLLRLPFPMDNLGRLIANHNRLMNSSVYTFFLPGGKKVEPLEVPKFHWIDVEIEREKTGTGGVRMLNPAKSIRAKFSLTFKRAMTVSEKEYFIKEYEKNIGKAKL